MSPSLGWAVDFASSGIIPLLLFGLSSAGLGLFLGRMLFAPAAVTAAPSDAPSNLRSSPRIGVAHAKVSLSRNTPLAEPFDGWVTDRSLGGLGLSVTQPIEIGTVLRLSGNPLPEWATTQYLEVRYCRLHRGRWRLGCQYVKA